MISRASEPDVIETIDGHDLLLYDRPSVRLVELDPDVLPRSLDGVWHEGGIQVVDF